MATPLPKMTLVCAVSACFLAGTVGAEGILDEIRARNMLWLAQDAPLPKLSYAFRLGDEVQRFTLETISPPHLRRGVSLTVGLDAFLGSPKEYKARLRYRGKLDGKDVLVLGVSGPAFRLISGNGIEGRWRGYRSSTASAAEIVVEEPTLRPIAELYGDMRILFLNWAEAPKEQQVPLRIVVTDDEQLRFDFRFQLLEGRVWLFDRSLDDKGKTVAHIEGLTLDGVPAANVKGADSIASALELTQIHPRRIAERTSLCPEDQLLTAIVQRNRPWLNPALDHLTSVEFVHHMEPKVLDERFAWRSDGTSLLEVEARADDKAAVEVGKRFLTTPEPAYYYLAPKAQLATAESVTDRFFHNHIRNHLMGTRTNFLTLDFGREPDRFFIEDVDRDSAKGHWLVRLVPKERKYHINAGAMFGTTSWAYVHHVRVAKSEVLVEAETRQPVRETDYGHEGEKVCEIEFLDYQQVGSGQCVPQLIHLRFPTYSFDVRYRFEWHPEGLWILHSGESVFEKTKKPQREQIRELKINQPVPSLDTALAIVEGTREYLQAKPAAETRSVCTHPFALQKPIQLAWPAREGHPPARIELQFLLDDKRNLLAKLSKPSPPLKGLVSMAMFDETLRIVGAAQTNYDPNQETQLNLGRWADFNHVRSFAVSLSRSPGLRGEFPEPLPETQRQSVPAYPAKLGSKIMVDVPDRAEGKSRAKEVLLVKDAAGEILGKVELISREHWKEFEIYVSAVLLDEDDLFLAAAQERVKLRVERAIATTQVTLRFGSPWHAEQVKRVLLGINRGRDLGEYHGHGVWMRFTSADG